METNHIEKEVVKLLLNLGISNAGYEYFKKALLICLKQDVIYSSACEVFAWTAEYYKIPYERVSRSMRFALEKADNLNTLYNLNELYGVKVLFARPSISEFFNMALEYLKVFKDCVIMKRHSI